MRTHLIIVWDHTMCVLQQHERGLGVNFIKSDMIPNSNFPGEHDDNPSKYVETDPYIEVFRSSNPPKKNQNTKKRDKQHGPHLGLDWPPIPPQSKNHHPGTEWCPTVTSCFITPMRALQFLYLENRTPLTSTNYTYIYHKP